jgi:hypothetical protein
MTTTANFTLGENRVPTDADNPPFGLHSLGLSRTFPNNGTHFDIPLFSAQGIFSNMTITFAYDNHGNGFSLVSLSVSTDGGASFTPTGVSATMITGGVFTVGLPVPAAFNNKPLTVLRMIFTGGTSNGNDPQTEIDNILIGGTIVPEPATVVGGLLGVLGLCFHQRRRLIRWVRFRRT